MTSSSPSPRSLRGNATARRYPAGREAGKHPGQGVGEDGPASPDSLHFLDMQRCPNCGEENPERARFCLTCGTPLTETLPRDQAEERKVVTILFCDLVG